MSRAVVDAVRDLFTAMGAERQAERATLYAEALSHAVRCDECAVTAIRASMMHARRLPPIGELVADAKAILSTDDHSPHILAPQLPGGIETFWHATATRIIRPHVETDDEASFIAAEMWFMNTPAEAELVSVYMADERIREMWKARMMGREVTPERVKVAWTRARKNAERPVVDWSDAEWNELAEA